MNGKKMLRYLTVALIGLTASGILMVSLMAFINPQSVMDLVQVKLANNDAYSSIRGVYGGAGMTLVIALIYLTFRDQMLGLLLVFLLCGFYALSRMTTIMVEGQLGAFGQQWLIIESALCLMAILIFRLRYQAEKF
jgi:hypothetical protein